MRRLLLTVLILAATACSATTTGNPRALAARDATAAPVGVAFWVAGDDGAGAWWIHRPDGSVSPMTADDVVPNASNADVDFAALAAAQADGDQDPKKPDCTRVVGGETIVYPPGSQVCFQGTTYGYPTIHVCVNGGWVDTGQECIPNGDG